MAKVAGMKCESPDLAQANIEKLAEIFPSVITEARDENGQLKKIVNFAALRQLLSPEVLEGDEAYEFTWVGKNQAIVEAAHPIRKTLRPCPKESRNWDTTENLYIEGDNLDVLKLLQENYLGKIRMIYIDPPYNTGNDFIYKDNFAIDKAAWQRESGELSATDTEKKRLFRNTDANGRFHSDWCSMIYPRLMLARNLLSPDGVIFISIDNNEFNTLKNICDNIFGNENFITNFAIENNPKGRKNNAFVAESFEYCLLYGKNIAYVYELLRIKNKKKFFNGIINTNDSRPLLFDQEGEFRQSKRQVCGTNKSSPLAANSGDERRFTIYYSAQNNKIELLDEYDIGLDKYIISSSGQDLLNAGYKRYICINGETGRPAIPLYTKKTLLELFAENRLYFKNDGSIYEKDREYSLQITPFISNKKYGLDLMTESATARMEALLGKKGIFANTKAVDFIKTLVFLYPADDFICLDFFSGSATTAHAVMQLNAEDGGRRKFIMVQLPEKCGPDSEACKAGYKNICEIGKERIRRAGDKIKHDNADKPGIENLDIGFRVLKCDSSNMKDVYYAAKATGQADLDGLISNIKDDRTDLDLLFGCLLEWGLPLSLPYRTEQICGYPVHFYDHEEGDTSALAACFDANISEDAIGEIARRKPLRAVFRDASFATSQARINAGELFKTLAPDTAVKVI